MGKLKKIISISLLTIIISVFAVPVAVLATDSAIMNTTKAAGDASGFKTKGDQSELASVVGIVINAFLSLLGVIFVALIVTAGFHWMTAQGADDKIKDAKNSIRSAIIGLIITIMAYAIWDFVWTYLT